MKHVAVAIIALTISSGSIANAGALADPVLEQEIIVEAATAASSSSGTTQVAMLALLLFAAAMSK